MISTYIGFVQDIYENYKVNEYDINLHRVGAIHLWELQGQQIWYQFT